MAKIIPREQIKHLEWVVGQAPPQPTQNPPNPGSAPDPTTPFFSASREAQIEALLTRGTEFYNNDTDGDGRYIGIAKSMLAAEAHAGKDGIVATMPYLIAGLSNADPANYLRQRWHTAYSEENVGLDTKGVIARGQPVVITLHGRGLWNPDTIMHAINGRLTPQNAGKLKQEDIDSILNERLPGGGYIKLCTLDDVRKITNPFGNYAIVQPYANVKDLPSGHLTKSQFMNNPLVLARAGTLDHLEQYFENIKSSDGTVGNWHRFNEIDASQPQGRVLFVDDGCNGLYGNLSLGGDGFFVGVAPEAPRRAKK